jgi:hypothetical protein
MNEERVKSLEAAVHRSIPVNIYFCLQKQESIDKPLHPALLALHDFCLIDIYLSIAEKQDNGFDKVFSAAETKYLKFIPNLIQSIHLLAVEIVRENKILVKPQAVVSKVPPQRRKNEDHFVLGDYGHPRRRRH